MAAARDWMRVHFRAKSNLAGIHKAPYVQVSAGSGDDDVGVGGHVHHRKPHGLRQQEGEQARDNVEGWGVAA